MINNACVFINALIAYCDICVHIEERQREREIERDRDRERETERVRE